jgi:predicted phage terminase large subunit-like protein
MIDDELDDLLNSSPSQEEPLTPQLRHSPLSPLTLEEIAQLEDELLDQMIDKARKDFYTFVKLMSPVVLPEEYTDGRHIELICRELQEVEESVKDKSRHPKRLQLFLPPGSMKSKMASNLFPAWCLGRNPNWCFLAIGSDFEFSVDNFGRPTKDLIDSPQYQAIFPDTILKKDVQSAGRWDTTKKGRFVARGAGQNIAGRRAHISIVDDALTEQTTDTERRKINNWYRKGLRTRLLPRGAEIIINTRWYIEDLSGFMLNIDGEEGVNEKTSRPWRVVSIPAILDSKASTYLRKGLPVGEVRFKVGTSFWPEFWPTELLLEKKDTMDPSEWSALYQQSPIATEGAIIKRKYFQPWTQPDPPKCKYVIVSMDTAFSTKESADFSAYSVWGVFQKSHKDFQEETEIVQDCLILLAAGKGRWDFGELCDKAQDLNRNYSPEFFIIEKKASGQSLLTEMAKRSLPVVPYMPERDKTFRLQATIPYFQANRIFVPENKQWAEELIAEVVSFNPKPSGGNSAAHDDYTDTLSQAILWMRDNYLIDNNGFSNRSEESEFWQGKRQTYWSSLFS